jgi:enoyl-CoA hydratase
LLMATSSAVTTQLIGEVLVIRVDDGKANALTPDVIQSVSDALTEGFEQAKAVTIIGREGKFSAGFDLKIMTSGVEQARDLLGAGAALGLKIFEAPVPVVLGVTGHALAMGGILTTCADYRVGADGPFKLGLNEVAIGMPVPIFGVELCRDRLSKRWFNQCVQTATLLTPHQAVEANYLDEVVSLEQVETRALDVATNYAASLHPSAFALTRKNCRAALAARLRESLTADLALFDVSA